MAQKHQKIFFSESNKIFVYSIKRETFKKMDGEKYILKLCWISHNIESSLMFQRLVKFFMVNPLPNGLHQS